MRDGWLAAFMYTYSFRKVSSYHPFHCQCLFCCNTHDYVIYGGNIQRGQRWSRLFPCRSHLFSCLEPSYIVPRSTQKSFLDNQYSSYHPQQLQIHWMLQNKKYSSIDVCNHTVLPLRMNQYWSVKYTFRTGETSISLHAFVSTRTRLPMPCSSELAIGAS